MSLETHRTGDGALHPGEVDTPKISERCAVHKLGEVGTLIGNDGLETPREDDNGVVGAPLSVLADGVLGVS